MTKNYMDRLIETKYFIEIEKVSYTCYASSIYLTYAIIYIYIYIYIQKKLLGLKLGSGKLKFIPKNNGLRLITNLTYTIGLVRKRKRKRKRKR
jgi:hypothetical protein